MDIVIQVMIMFMTSILYKIVFFTLQGWYILKRLCMQMFHDVFVCLTSLDSAIDCFFVSFSRDTADR